MENKFPFIDLLFTVNNIININKSKNGELIANSVLTEIGRKLNLEAIYYIETNNKCSLKSYWENDKTKSNVYLF